MTLAVSQAAGREAVKAPSSRPAAEPDAELREYLREWRRKTAKEHGLLAYLAVHDTTLEDVSRTRPSSLWELRKITGIG